MHLPVLPVVLPLLAAPICLMFNRSRIAWGLATLATFATWFVCLYMFNIVSHDGPITYELGGWAPPMGIEYRIDLLSAWMQVIISSVAVFAVIVAFRSIEHEIDSGRQVYFYVAFLLCLGALLGIVSSADIFNIFVLLEISALATYVLIAMGSDRMALWASFQYLIVGTVGATFFLIGIGLLYAMTGTLNLADLATRLPELHGSRTVMTAFCFMSIGILLKVAVYPLHTWLVNAYTHPPSIVSAFLSATATKTALYLIIRLYWDVFGTSFAFEDLPMDMVLMAIGLAGIFVGSLRALKQDNVKAVFAYSSVSQIGYLILGIGLMNATGLTATLIHVFNHAMMKALVFLALAGVLMRMGGVTITHLQGLGRQMPITAACIVIAGLSLIGVPATAGFVSKWYLVIAAVEQGYWFVAAAILVGSLVTAAYIWRLVEIAYLRPPVKEANEAPLSVLVPIVVLAAMNIYFGLDASLTAGTSEKIAMMLFGANP